MVYEIAYLILPSISEDNVAPEVSKLKETLASVEAEVVSDEYPVLISLEYEMVKRIDTKNTRFNQGYFGWVKFEAKPEDVAKIKKALDLNKVLLRYMIVTTVRENTIASKKPLASNIITRSSRAPKRVVEDKAPIDKEAVDQEIDKLVEGVEENVEENKVESTEETTQE